MSSILQFTNETDPSSCQRSLIIQDLPLETTLKEMNFVISKHLGQARFRIEFGIPYIRFSGKEGSSRRTHIPVCSDRGSKERKRAYVNCELVESVNRLMKARPILLRGKELVISRMVPKTYTYHGHVTSSLAVKLTSEVPCRQAEMQFVKEGLEKHFQAFGKVLAGEWIISTHLIIFAFDDYDIVDQIMLAPHPSMIHQFQVQLLKTLRKPQDLSPSLRCTHLMNLPVDVTSRELASIFQVHPADIFLKPANPLQYHLRSPGQSISGEAWIKGTSHSSKTLRGVSISTEIVEEPMQSAQFCLEFRQGQCQRLASECYYQHTLCSQPDACESVECVYGHYFSYSRGFINPQQHRFRLKWTNIPSTMNKEQFKRLFPSIDASYLRFSPNLSYKNVVYLVDQTSANFLRKLIHQCPQVQCQLETNEDFFDWDCPVDISRSIPPSSKNGSIAFKPAPWYKPTNSEQ